MTPNMTQTLPNPLFVATGNPHKLSEIEAILEVRARGLRDVPDAPDVVEDGETFEENAIKKAVSLAVHTGQWALADDSGLEVDALDGAPGVKSARFAGRHGDDAANNALLLEKLRDTEHRSARFVCVIALCGPGGEVQTYRGECRGRISRAPKGMEGFGYDPLFVPDGYEKTFGELGEEVKHRLSHRFKALEAFRANRCSSPPASPL